MMFFFAMLREPHLVYFGLNSKQKNKKKNYKTPTLLKEPVQQMFLDNYFHQK